jgi:cytochrome c peroxidase
MRKGVFQLCVLLALSLTACKNDDTLLDENVVVLPQPKGFPAFTSELANELTESRITLGKKLFYETRLSEDNSLSCGSCHKAEYAFADSADLSPGIRNQTVFRNTQPLFNLAWSPHFFRDGGVNRLHLAVLNPIQNPVEFDNSLLEIVNRLQLDQSYVTQFNKAYPDGLSGTNLLHALTCFQLSMISANSRYDAYINGIPSSLNDAEKRGMQLFFSQRTGCNSCHTAPLFTRHEFKSNGFFIMYADSGRQRITMLESDRGLFSVPSLRNIAHTAPYMHNGSVKTLEDVVATYNHGGNHFANKDSLIRPLNLSDSERADIVAFLKSLSDPSFINDKRFKPN